MKKQLSILGIALLSCTILMTSCKKPAASFTADKETAAVGEAVNFTNTSTDAAKVMWDFGDGTQSASTQTGISHVYQRPGEYTVSMTATKKNGKKASDAPTKTITVTGVSANFTASKSNPAAGETVTFTSNSVGAEELDWDFGDGSTSEIHNAVQTHSYSTGGSYTVTLTAYGINHSMINTKSMVITVGGASGNNVNLAMIIGAWKYQSKIVTDKRALGSATPTTFSSNNAGTSVGTNNLYSVGSSSTFTDNHEFTSAGTIIKTDVNGNYLTAGSFSLLDGTRMSYSGLSTNAYLQSNVPYATYTVSATTLTITYVSTNASLPAYTDFSVTPNVPHPAGEKQIVTTTYTYVK
jgi:PKD repeat protein